MFFSAATIAGSFGGLLARLINLMDGKLRMLQLEGFLANWRTLQVPPGTKDGDGE